MNLPVTIDDDNTLLGPKASSPKLDLNTENVPSPTQSPISPISPKVSSDIFSDFDYPEPDMHQSTSNQVLDRTVAPSSKVKVSSDVFTEDFVLNTQEAAGEWESDDDLLNEHYLDSIMGNNTAGSESQNVLKFNLNIGFENSQVHKTIEWKDILTLYPEADQMRTNIVKSCKLQNNFIVFNRSIYIAVENVKTSNSRNKDDTRVCYLAGCKRFISPHESIAYLAVIHPPCNPYNEFPFKIEEAFPRNGAISCKLHGLVSQDITYIHHANALYRPAKLIPEKVNDNSYVTNT